MCTFALVEWTEGSDKGLRSILPIDCVRDFHEENYLNGDEKTPEEFLVEWRHGRKGANRQWPVYQARIIKVASMYTLSIFILSRQRFQTKDPLAEREKKQGHPLHV